MTDDIGSDGPTVDDPPLEVAAQPEDDDTDVEEAPDEALLDKAV